MPRPSTRPVVANGSARCRAIRPTGNTTKNPPEDGRWYWRVEAPDASTGRWATIGTFKWLTEERAEHALKALLKDRTGGEAAADQVRAFSDEVVNVGQLLKAWLEKHIVPAVERRRTVEEKRDANWSFSTEDDRAKKGKRTSARKRLPGVATRTGEAYASAARRIINSEDWAPDDDGALLAGKRLSTLGNASRAPLLAYYDARLKMPSRKKGGGIALTEDGTPKMTAENTINGELDTLALAWKWGVEQRYCRGSLAFPTRGAADDATEEPHRMPTREEADKVIPLLNGGKPYLRDAGFVLSILGCRPEAIYRLRHNEVDPPTKRVRLKAKGFDRTVRVPRSVIAVLSRYAQQGEKGRIWPEAHATMSSALPAAFREACERTNIEPFGPYGLRALVSREHILAGTKPHAYALIMGHSPARALADYAGVLHGDEVEAWEGLEHYHETERAKLRAV
jgi:hypothetical protein